MQAYWKSCPGIRKDLEEVRAVIRTVLRNRNPLLSETLDKLLSRKGKMLRPAFILLAARMSRKPLPEKIYRIAAAMEIMHLATLVHDDVIDRAATRRGEASLNADFGERRAVLLGDYLFSRSFSLVADNASMKSARYLAVGVSHICDSEISQSRRFDRADLSVRNYLHRIMGKTAVLFSLSFHVGAAENGLSPRVASRLRRIGYNVGMSFQIIDDLLDFTGDENILGKPAGGDLRDGIFTLPVIHAFRRDPAGLGPLLNSRSLSDRETLEQVIRRIEALGGFEKARFSAALYTDRALRETSGLPRSEHRDILAGVIRKLLTRSY